jgi:sugar phosphate isomerase/epimerase
MIQLAFSTNAFKKNTLSKAIDAIAQVGYRGVELMADVPHAYPATFGAAERAALREQLGRLNLTVSNINGFTHFAAGDTYHPTWIEEDAAKRQVRIEHTRGCIELAAEFGAKTVSLQPGGPLIGTGISRQLAGRRFADGLLEVLPLAKKKGVVLAVEPEPGLFIETAEEYLAFKTEFFRDEPLVKMNCDVGHLFCANEDPAAVISVMHEHVAHVHLEDIGANHVHQHLTPGKGVIDFAAIFTALRGVHYAGWVTVELYPYETTAAGVAKAAWDHLQKILAR